MHFYVFTWHDKDEPGCPTYERTMGDIHAARRWLDRCSRRGFICVDCLPPHYWY